MIRLDLNSARKMKTAKNLLQSEDRWVTDLGALFPGERVVYRGKDLFKELSDKSWMELFLFGITGREFTKNQLTLFERLWSLSISYPDPRIWNNRIAALAGTVRSTGNLGVGAAVSVTEAAIYGQRTNIGAIDFLLRAKKSMDDGLSLNSIIKNELKKFRVIYGYGRPLVSEDERVKPVLEMAKGLGFKEGMYTQLALQVDKVVREGRWRLRMNIGALAAGLCADQGLSVREYYHFAIPAYLGGIIPCYVDAVGKPEGTFFPFRCSRIKYNGPERRSW